MASAATSTGGWALAVTVAVALFVAGPTAVALRRGRSPSGPAGAPVSGLDVGVDGYGPRHDWG